MGDLLDSWSTALGINADTSFSTPRTELAVPMNALQSMQPLTQAQPGGTWGDFWGGVQGALQTGLQYAIAKDAAKAGLVSDGRGGYTAVPNQQQMQPQGGVYVPAPSANGTTMMLILGGVAVLGVVLLMKD